MARPTRSDEHRFAAGRPRTDWGEARRGPRDDDGRGHGGYRQERDHRGARLDDRSDRSDRYARDDRPPRERPSGSRIRAEDEGQVWPEIPEWVDVRDLGPEVLADLRGLSKQGAEFVAGHLAAAGELADTEPEKAWEHARAARSQGGRIAVVRETVGLVAYRAGQWTDAIAELRAARRMAGGPGLLAVMADAERALGRPERAIELSRSPESTLLDPAAAAELQIVVAGARSDLGQHDAARAALGAAARDVDPAAPYAFRLYYAFAAQLEAAGRSDEALEWFVRAADADGDDESDAADRAQALAASADADADADADGRTSSGISADGSRGGFDGNDEPERNDGGGPAAADGAEPSTTSS